MIQRRHGRSEHIRQHNNCISVTYTLQRTTQTIMVADVPLLALPKGSILQFLLMTLPLLCVYLYFLYLAYDRPTIANPNNPNYMKDRITLMDIQYTYLITLIIFVALVVYLLWFVNKRRKLSKRYETEAITILGNVEYNESYYTEAQAESSWYNCFWNTWQWFANGFSLRNNYGRVVYDLERVANHPACDYEERTGKALTGTISKKIRVFYRYPREQVSILVLPGYPYSGQPKKDCEADWASFSTNVGLPDEEDEDILNDPRVSMPEVLSRDRSLGVLFVALFWICFLLGAALYVTFQIEVIEDVYDDEDSYTAWRYFYIAIGGGIPIISFGGNYLRWKIYERWVLMSGKKKREKKSKKSGETMDDAVMDNEEGIRGGSYVQMT